MGSMFSSQGNRAAQGAALSSQYASQGVSKNTQNAQNAAQYASQGLSKSGKPIQVYKYNRQDALRNMTPEQILAIDINDVPNNIDDRFANPPLSDAQLAAVEELAAKKARARPYNSGGGARKRRRKTRKIRKRKSRKLSKK